MGFGDIDRILTRLQGYRLPNLVFRHVMFLMDFGQFGGDVFNSMYAMYVCMMYVCRRSSWIFFAIEKNAEHLQSGIH